MKTKLDYRVFFKTVQGTNFINTRKYAAIRVIHKALLKINVVPCSCQKIPKHVIHKALLKINAIGIRKAKHMVFNISGLIKLLRMQWIKQLSNVFLSKIIKL